MLLDEFPIRKTIRSVTRQHTVKLTRHRLCTPLYKIMDDLINKDVAMTNEVSDKEATVLVNKN